MAEKKAISKKEPFLKPLLDKYRNLHIYDKRIFWIFIWTIFVALVVGVTVESIRNLDNDLSLSECNNKIVESVRFALSLQEENKYLAFIYAFQKPIVMMLMAIGLAWVLHGVGFHLIKR